MGQKAHGAEDVCRSFVMPQTEAIGVPIHSYPVDARLQDRPLREPICRRVRAGLRA